MCIFARQTTFHAMKAKLLLILMAAFALLLGSCQNHPQTLSGQIDRLKRQVNDDAIALRGLEETEWPQLQNDFRHCDSMLQHMDSAQVAAAFEKLNLVQAYLNQFSELKTDMRQKMEYSLLQLDRLKADAESHYITDSLAAAYLKTETQVADTLHHRVLYFQEKFGNCRKSLSDFKK